MKLYPWLGIPGTGEVGSRLQALAQRQSELSGEKIDWLGSYQHAIDSFMRHKERELVSF